jgi:hypothetical protein
MRHIFCIILNGLLSFITISGQVSAQELAVSNIPETLLRGANSVVRDRAVTISLTGDGQYIHRESIKLTIINEKALDLAHLKIFYNTGEKVVFRTAAVFNSDGVKIKSVKQSEMADYSAAGDLTIYSDARVIYCRIVPTSYPFSVFYDYEITYNHLYALKPFSPYASDNQSIEKSSLTLLNPSGIPLNIKKLNLPGDVFINETGNSGLWMFSNLMPLTEEPYMPEAISFLPLIKIVPEQISYGNFIGSSDSWANYGKWIARLSSGRKSLSGTTVSLLNRMISNAPSQREKVRIIYKYLQSKTHYISISLGIGGLQPHEAFSVDELGYGDCKDLSNYMVSMLDAVGIKSYYTIVNSGEGQYSFQKDQPGHQFDHAIVCVPLGNDTTWLECTSQISPFGYLGTFTDNRNVLVIKDDSGELVRTPEYTINDNYINSRIVVDHSADGTAAHGTISFSGLMMDDEVFAANQNTKDQIAWLNKNLEIKDFTLINHHYNILEDPKPVIRLDVELALKSFFTGANGRLFASLNLNNTIEVPARVRSRKHPLYIPYSYQSSDTVTVNMPAGYKPEQLPVSSVNDERFGSYSMKTVYEAGNIICIRKFELYIGTHSPEVYSAFYDFMQKTAIADSKQLVLIQEP